MAITVTFYQMFLLANIYDRTVRTKYLGGVVLSPSHRHISVMHIDGGLPILLRDVQIDIMVDGKSLWARAPGRGRPPKEPTGYDAFVVRAEEIFPGIVPITLQKDLVESTTIPPTISCRFVLADGVFSGRPSAHLDDTDWTFDPTGPKNKRLTDILQFEWLEAAGELPQSLAVRFTGSPDGSGQRPTCDKVLNPSENHSIVLANLDVADSVFPLPGGVRHDLFEYDDIHALLDGLGGRQSHPHGTPRVRGAFSRLNEEPICGGEQTDPDPPQTPPGPGN